MNSMLKTARVLALLALVFIMAGCGTATPSAVQPTADLDAVRTEVVKTMVAKMTIEAALNPTATAETPQTIIITATPAPTNTPAPQAATATLAPLPTLTKAPVTGGGGGVYPTKTPLRPDAASYVSNTPIDGTKMSAGSEFDGMWTLKNIGTTTWNSKYYYRYAGKGENLAKADRYYLKGDVKPGDTVNLYADMVAPSEGGRHVSYWELVNDNGETFAHFYIIIDVE